jgi:catechol-2,3-dioxygenase
VKVVGITDHGFCESIYFFDPSGHRLEMTIRTDSAEERQKFAKEAGSVLGDWQRRKDSGELQAPPAA